MVEKTLISLVGPTAIGKTALSITLAKAYNTEIVSCDSRQLYKEMCIGTAVPTGEELAQVPHHFIQSHSIHEPLAAGAYEKEAMELLDRLFKKHRVVLLTGGSGLFEKAVVEGFDQFPTVSKKVSLEVEQLYQEKGIAKLLYILSNRDPETHSKIDQNNHRRVVRAVELVLAGGKPLQYWKGSQSSRPFKTIRIGLQMDRIKLYERINHRVDQMMAHGLLAEVESLQNQKDLSPLNTVGYTELFDYLEGNHSLEEAIELIKRNTRRFAKRQFTWFRKYEDLQWFEAADTMGISAYLKKAIK